MKIVVFLNNISPLLRVHCSSVRLSRFGQVGFILVRTPSPFSHPPTFAGNVHRCAVLFSLLYRCSSSPVTIRWCASLATMRCLRRVILTAADVAKRWSKLSKRSSFRLILGTDDCSQLLRSLDTIGESQGLESLSIIARPTYQEPKVLSE